MNAQAVAEIAQIAILTLGTVALAAILIALGGLASYVAMERFISLVTRIGNVLRIERELTTEEFDTVDRIIKQARKRIREKKQSQPKE